MSSKKKELSFSLSDLNILILGAKLGIGASLARSVPSKMRMSF